MIDEKDIKNEEQFEEEVPTIVIEKVEDPQEPSQSNAEVKIIAPIQHRPWLLYVGVAVIILLLGIVAWQTYLLRRIPTAPDLNVSRSSQEVIDYLQTPLTNQEMGTRPSVTVREDSLNDVHFKEYALNGLKATLSFDEPSQSDKDVYLYCHSADYRADNGQVLDACVIDGNQVSTGNNRSGYLAIMNDRTVIGVSKDDSVQNYIQENGGSFFRQFALVSAGEQGDIRLKKGKVERCAIGRKGDQLYFVQSNNPESLYDFTEALTDYGYTDVIYITGGKSYCYYRDAQGTLHEIGSNTKAHKPIKNAKAPFLVFKRR